MPEQGRVYDGGDVEYDALRISPEDAVRTAARLDGCDCAPLITIDAGRAAVLHEPGCSVKPEG